MGFRNPNLEDVHWVISKTLVEITSPYNDGWTASACKRDLYLLKCWLEDQYDQLPRFSGEENWEKEREQQQIIETLKK